MQRGRNVRGTEDRLIFGALVWPMSEGDQKKDGNRSKPGKPKPDKSKTESSKREGDKGSQRVKRPKRDESASSTLAAVGAELVPAHNLASGWKFKIVSKIRKLV